MNKQTQLNDQSKLLVVDDESVVCESCSRIFSERGFEVVTCTDSVRGLDLAAEQSYRAILVDLMMPNVDGLEFLRRLREHDPSVPVIFITGYASVPTAAEAMRLGAADYIPKPFTPEEIFNAVQRVFDETEAPSQNETAEETVIKPVAEKSAETTETIQPVTRSGKSQILFYGNSWTESGEAGENVPVGALIPPTVANDIVSIHLPKVGSQVYQGLPMAWMQMKNSNTQIVPAPISGKILDVNTAYKLNSIEPVETIGESWMAIVEPNGPAYEQNQLTHRLALVLSNNPKVWQSSSQYLNQIGCNMMVVSNYQEAKELLMKGSVKLFVLDGSDRDVEGPERVRELNWHFPSVRVVVANDACSQERAYRSKKIAYYSGGMLSPLEWIELCASVYKQEWYPHRFQAETPPHAKCIKCIQVKTQSGQTTSLVFRNMDLKSDTGLGSAIRHRLLAEGYPVNIHLGINETSVADLKPVMEASGRVIMIEQRDAGKAPGWIEECKEVLLPMDFAEKTTMMVLQPYDMLKDKDGINDAIAALMDQLITKR